MFVCCESNKQMAMSGSVEKTLAIIKPDAIAGGFEEDIRDDVRDAGFTIVAEKRILVCEFGAGCLC